MAVTRRVHLRHMTSKQLREKSEYIQIFYAFSEIGRFLENKIGFFAGFQQSADARMKSIKFPIGRLSPSVIAPSAYSCTKVQGF